MQNINLNKGLIVLGGLKNGGKTRFALQLANQLAQKEKVLYLSYQDYPEKLYATLQRMGCELSEKLKIRSNLAYYGAGFFIQVLQLIKQKGFTTLVLDDMECLNQFRDFDSYDSLEEDNTDPLHFIADLMDIRIIVLVNIINDLWKEATPFPKLRNFVYCRNLAMDAKQVFALYYPYQMGIQKDLDGNSTQNRIELHCLKNDLHIDQVYEFDNDSLRIFPV